MLRGSCQSVSVLNTPPWQRSVSSAHIRSRPPRFVNRLTTVIIVEVSSRSSNRYSEYFTAVSRTNFSPQEPTTNFSILYIRWYLRPHRVFGDFMHANVSEVLSPKLNIKLKWVMNFTLRPVWSWGRAVVSILQTAPRPVPCKYRAIQSETTHSWWLLHACCYLQPK